MVFISKVYLPPDRGGNHSEMSYAIQEHEKIQNYSPVAANSYPTRSTPEIQWLPVMRRSWVQILAASQFFRFPEWLSSALNDVACCGSAFLLR